jgi:hypothetical protein
MKSPLTAALLVVVGLVSYRQLSGFLAAGSVGPESAARFRSIDWSLVGDGSQAFADDPAIQQQLGADVVVHRMVVVKGHPIELWVNHYTNARRGVEHSPDVCFSTQGWRNIGSRTVVGAREGEVSLNVERFSLKGETVTVVSTFLIGVDAHATRPGARMARWQALDSAVVFTMAVVRVDDAGAESAAAALIQSVVECVRRAASEPLPE